jgi:hypothetical protein
LDFKAWKNHLALLIVFDEYNPVNGKVVFVEGSHINLHQCYMIGFIPRPRQVQWRRKINNQISGEFVDYECQIMCNCKKCRAPGNHGREKKLQSPPPPKHTKMK